jgi:hypothetical protein
LVGKALSGRFKFTAIGLTLLMLLFLVLNVLLVMTFSNPTPIQNSLIENTARAWQLLLGAIVGFFGGKIL